MVSFRYHVVSLVSVFLALAVGIVLGAGPLQGSIGDTLTKQVESLRDSRDEARQRLEESRAELDESNEALQSTRTQLVDGTLSGRKVAFLVLPGTPQSVVVDAQAAVEEADGTVTGQMELTDGYTDAKRKKDRADFVTQLGPSIGLDAGAKTEEALPALIDHVLRNGTQDANASTIASTMGEGEKAILSINEGLTDPADVVVILGPEQVEGNGSKDAYTSVYKSIATRAPTVGLAVGSSDDSLVAAWRETNVGSTVDSAGGIVADINTPIAVANEILGQHVHLGSGSAAEALVGTKTDAAVPAEPSGEPGTTDSEG
ncbi:MAG: copper transporter [Actinomycetaceae bacterium]|nr:copper transporter [Actinomycetaceae bacterium]